MPSWMIAFTVVLMTIRAISFGRGVESFAPLVHMFQIVFRDMRYGANAPQPSKHFAHNVIACLLQVLFVLGRSAAARFRVGVLHRAEGFLGASWELPETLVERAFRSRDDLGTRRQRDEPLRLHPLTARPFPFSCRARLTPRRTTSCSGRGPARRCTSQARWPCQSCC